MQDLVYEMAGNQAQAACSLLDDTSVSLSMKRTLGKMLLSRGITLYDPFDQLLLLTSQAPFATEEEECVLIAKFIYRFIHTKQDETVLPMVTQHRGVDLASRCLISLAMFYKNLEFRHQRYGSPSPTYYRHAGIWNFETSDLEALAAHFRSWELFLNEMLLTNGETNYEKNGRLCGD